ncbi:MAG: site-specific DNA-methyltransferase [Candidatus Sericytochromatia bacterium]|nr:site-specific DNA-methyltransferase [Candidatus Sericytochromatia bacterium]
MLQPDTRYKADAEALLALIPATSLATAFFDPQYRGVLDKLVYGNEGERQRERALLPQMDEAQIGRIMHEIGRVLRPSGHLFLWLDKFHLCEGIGTWVTTSGLETVDLITWDKGRIGMGYRTRRRAEYLLVLQKPPKRAKGVWTRHNIPDVWEEKAQRGGTHTHGKPYGLVASLIESTVPVGEFVLDPAAGSFVVREAALAQGRHFLGGDLVYGDAALPESGLALPETAAAVETAKGHKK